MGRGQRPMTAKAAPAIVRMPDAATLAGAFAFEHGNMHTVVDEAVARGTSMELRGRVRTGNTDCGEWVRWMRLDEIDNTRTLVAKHSYLYVNADMRGRGFARAFTTHMDDHYRRWGVHHVEIHAEHDGAFVWALDPRMRLHANAPYPPHSTRYPSTPTLEAVQLRAIARRGMSRVEQAIEEGFVSASVMDDLRLLPDEHTGNPVFSPELDPAVVDASWQYPVQLAQWGRDRRWLDVNGEPTWAGRECLLGNHWAGWRSVQKHAHTRLSKRPRNPMTQDTA